MRPLTDIAIAIAIAAVVGLTSAWFAIERGYIFGAVSSGEWTAWLSAGASDADPYAMAHLARTGEVPLGAGEGLAFNTAVDHDGEPLTGGCTYRIVGQTPAARLWTLTAYDAEGRLMANPAQRSGFHSREIVRRPDGSFDIAVSSDVQSGNWLPVDPSGDFTLTLRLYDTPLTTGGTLVDSDMPAIRREACR
ncbi:DUF1214 domain-containing protein [Bauldia sp.]|uniref:DUF1214 domain-containing protein n=1 Tax=Bauldia sp. TaxID=2575872 RepID=UPI003BAD343C